MKDLKKTFLAGFSVLIILLLTPYYLQLIGYESAVVESSQQEEIIKEHILEVNQNLYENKIITEVKKIKNFYTAEQYHQGYYKLNAQQPYCNSVITPKVLKARKKLNKYY